MDLSWGIVDGDPTPTFDVTSFDATDINHFGTQIPQFGILMSDQQNLFMDASFGDNVSLGMPPLAEGETDQFTSALLHHAAAEMENMCFNDEYIYLDDYSTDKLPVLTNSSLQVPFISSDICNLFTPFQNACPSAPEESSPSMNIAGLLTNLDINSFTLSLSPTAAPSSYSSSPSFQPSPASSEAEALQLVGAARRPPRLRCVYVFLSIVQGFVIYNAELTVASSRQLRQQDKPEKCPICSKGHPYRRELIEHINVYHSDDASRLGVKKTRPVCQYCKKSFARKCNRKRHLDNSCKGRRS